MIMITQNPPLYKSHLQFAFKKANAWAAEYDRYIEEKRAHMDDALGLAIGYPFVFAASFVRSFKRLHRGPWGLVDTAASDTPPGGYLQ